MSKKIITHSNGVVETRETFYTEETVNQLKQQLEKVQQENKILKDIRFLERVVPANSQLHQLSNRECYIKGYENAISETLRVFGESYGKDKVKLITERDELLMDIEKVGGYKFQIEELKQQLVEKDKEIERLKVFEKAYYFNQLQASQEDIQQFQQLANQSAVNINHIAITELKKVKEKINKLPITDILDTDYGGFKKIYQTDAIRIIDQQINELKGEKE